MILNNNLKNKINFFKKLKNSEICIISDFDDTITKGIVNGVRGSNSFSVFENNSHLLGVEQVKESNILFNYYYPLERKENMSEDKKIKLMISWWEKEFELYKKYKLTQKVFDKIIDENLIELKNKVFDFFNFTKENKIETIIFSAGIYNLIHSFLKKNKMDFENIHVIANQIFFNKVGDFIKLKGDLIHSQNKTFKELSSLPIFNDLKNKKGCILIGDSFGDLKMVEGSDFDVVLNIGFFNSLKNEKDYLIKKKLFKDKFDLILDGGEDFSKINNILKRIFQE